jgi:hypothetical protein
MEAEPNAHARDDGQIWSIAVKDWKTYLLGIFLTISMATSSIVYSNAIDRVEKVELAQTQADKAAVSAAVNLAVVQATLEEMKLSLAKMDHNQDKLVEKLDTLVSNTIRDSRRWNDEMDKFQKQKSK